MKSGALKLGNQEILSKIEVFETKIKDQNKALLDSGTNQNLSNDKALFTTGIKPSSDVKIQVANGQEVKAKGWGQMAIPFGNSKKIAVGNGLYVPQCTSTLISVSKLVSNEDCHELVFDKTGCYFIDKANQNRTKIASIKNGLYVVD